MQEYFRRCLNCNRKACRDCGGCHVCGHVTIRDVPAQDILLKTDNAQED